MLHASVLTLRTTMSAAQNAPVFDAMSDSTARRVPSRPTLYPPPCAARRAALSRTLSRNPCNTERDQRLQELLSTNGGRSARYGRQRRRRQPDESGDTTRSISNACWPSSAQMTTVRLTPTRGRRLQRASRKVQATELPFFEPSGDGLARDAESARESAQTTAFVVSAKYLFARRFWISIAARLFATALTAVAAQITLAAIRSQTVTHKSFALAVLTSQSKSDHR